MSIATWEFQTEQSSSTHSVSVDSDAPSSVVYKIVSLTLGSRAEIPLVLTRKEARYLAEILTHATEDQE